MHESRPSAAFLAALEAWKGHNLGAGLNLSPRDQAVVLQWEESGVPADAVIRALDRALARATTTPRTLAAFSREVEAAIKAYHQAHPARGADAPAAAPAVARYCALIERLGTQGDTPAAAKRVLRRAWVSLHRAQIEEGVDPTALWLRVRRQIMVELEAALPKGECGHLRHESQRQCQARAAQMSPEGAAAYVQAHFEAALLRHFAVHALLDVGP